MIECKVKFGHYDDKNDIVHSFETEKEYEAFRKGIEAVANIIGQHDWEVKKVNIYIIIKKLRKEFGGYEDSKWEKFGHYNKWDKKSREAIVYPEFESGEEARKWFDNALWTGSEWQEIMKYEYGFIIKSEFLTMQQSVV